MGLTASQRASWSREGDRRIQATVEQAKAAVAAAGAEESAGRIAAYDRRYAPVPYTPAELAAATHVRTVTGWHRVVKVNAKSVTVETGHSWTDRHPLDKVLEVRSLA